MMSFPSMVRRGIPALLLTAFVVSCDSQDPGLLDPGEIPGPSYEIADGSALGRAGFEDVNPYVFFLPPLVPNPKATRTFDPTLELKLVIEIWQCPLGSNGIDLMGRRRCDGGSLLGGTVTGELPGVGRDGEVYQVDWDTDAFAPNWNDELFYRIAVLYVDGASALPLPLGHVDVQFGATGKVVKEINNAASDFIGLKDGRTLPIKFRIEKGATEFARVFPDHQGTVDREVAACSTAVDGGSIIDCDVQVIIEDPLHDQQLVVWAQDGGRTEPAGVVTFTPGSSPPDGVTVVVKYAHPPYWPDSDEDGISPEIPDLYEIPPFLTVDLFYPNGDPYTTELGGSGARVAWCHDVDASLDMSKYSIYKVDDLGDEVRETVLLETGQGADCGLFDIAYAPQPEKDGSFLGRIRDGLNRVAAVLTPRPLRAMHGGLNTEGPIRRFSDFGAVNLTAQAGVDPGIAGVHTDITVWLEQAPEANVGGDGDEPYVGAAPGDDLVTVAVTGGPNAGAEVSDPVFDPGTGIYTASYTPTLPGEDIITVTVGTRVQQTVILTSQVQEHPSCALGDPIDCVAAELDPTSEEEQQLVVWATDGGVTEPAGVLTFWEGSVPTGIPGGVIAVLKYIEPDAPNYFPSPEIPNEYELPPFLTVELFNGNGVRLTDYELGGELGARLDWCHDVLASLEMDNLAIYQVDDVGDGVRETVLLETGDGDYCLQDYALAPKPEKDGSFFGRMRDGLTRVASVLKPEPLRAMHGGLNTEGPIRGFSDFGATRLSALAEVDAGVVGEFTEIRVWLEQAPGDPVGGATRPDESREPFVRAGPNENLVTVAATSEDNVDYPVSLVDFNYDTGIYTFQYKPLSDGTDDILVTVGTRDPDQEVSLTSVVAPAGAGTGTLFVTVRNELGAPVVGAQVTILGTSFGGATGDAGTVPVGPVPLGTYTVVSGPAAATVTLDTDDQTLNVELKPVVTITNLTFSTTNLVIGQSPAATFNLTINNGTSTTYSDVDVQGLLGQLGIGPGGTKYERGAGAWGLRCNGGASGELPSGSECVHTLVAGPQGFDVELPINPAVSWVSGDAYAWIELRIPGGAPLAVDTVDVTLVKLPISEGFLWGVDSNSDGLSQYNLAGGGTSFGPLSALAGTGDTYLSPVAMAVRPSDHALLVWNNSGDAPEVPGGNNGVLLAINACTMKVTKVSTAAQNADIGGIAIDQNGRLWGARGQGQIFEIDPHDGHIISGPTTLKVGSTAGADFTGTIWGLDFDGTQTLYGITAEKKFIEIDPVNGVVVSSLDLDPVAGTNVDQPQSLTFSPAGVLFGSKYLGGYDFFTIDKATGIATTATVGGRAQGMTFGPDRAFCPNITP